MGAPAAGNGRPIPDPAVAERPVRRRFTAEYKRGILREADRAIESGQLGALLRREGLYSSHLSTWRQQRDAGTLAGLTPKHRGRKANPDAPLVAENERLKRETQRLSAKLRQAKTIIEVQKQRPPARLSIGVAVAILQVGKEGSCFFEDRALRMIRRQAIAACCEGGGWAKR